MADAIRPPKTQGHLVQLRKMMDANDAGPPIAQLIGFRPVKVELGDVVMQMRAEKRHANPMGTLHGGVVCDLGDAAMGMAMATTLEDDESFTTIDLSVKFFKPVWDATLRASGLVYRRTRTLGFISCEVTDESGAAIARLDSTCMVLRGDSAKGR